MDFFWNTLINYIELVFDASPIIIFIGVCVIIQNLRKEAREKRIRRHEAIIAYSHYHEVSYDEAAQIIALYPGYM